MVRYLAAASVVQRHVVDLLELRKLALEGLAQRLRELVQNDKGQLPLLLHLTLRVLVDELQQLRPLVLPQQPLRRHRHHAE